MEYRVEDKYIVTVDTAALIEYELRQVCRTDRHGEDGRYLIRSVYFDDMYDTCFKENEAGTDNREKFRIRIYDTDEDMIRLELKSKYRGYTRKESVRLSKNEALRLLDRDDRLYSDEDSGRYLKDRDPYLIKKICAEMQYRRLQPVVLIEYERTAYVCDTGNVRITLDRNIGACTDHMDLWSRTPAVTPVMPAGMHILEIKYDELLPDHVRNIIDIGSLQRTAYSKYYYGRLSV